MNKFLSLKVRFKNLFSKCFMFKADVAKLVDAPDLGPGYFMY